MDRGPDTFTIPMRPPRPGRRSQTGLTLIETVVAMAVLTIGVVGIAYGFTAATRSASVSQEEAAQAIAARQLAGYVQSNPDVSGDGLQYEVCATAYSLNPPPGRSSKPPSPPAGISWAITNVTESTHETGIAYPGTPVDPWGQPLPATCRPPGTSIEDYGVQEIQITVYGGRGVAPLTRNVWKGDL